MKIVEIIPSFEPLGGAENFVFNLSLFLKKHEDVFVVSLYTIENAYISEKLKNSGIKIFYLNKRKGYDFSCSKSLRRLLNEIEPDVVHLHLNSYLPCLNLILRQKYKFIYTFHTLISKDTYGKKYSPQNLLLKFLMRKNLLFPITISNTIDKSFKEFFGSISTKIIYNGINVDKYVYNAKTPKKYTFISVGSFNDIKNNLFMIKCVEKLIDEGFDINYLVLGKGKNFELCKNYCIYNMLDKKIILLGAVNNVEKYLGESACLLLASHWEGNPLVINEAIASGVWVVANGVGGVKDLIGDTNGYLVEPENESDFIDKMKKYLNHIDEISNNIIPQNIDENRKKVDLVNTCQEYLALINELIGD